MKSILLAAAVLLIVSGVVFGQTPPPSPNSFVITGPGGTSVYFPAPGGVFEITVTITGPYNRMTAWSGNLAATSPVYRRCSLAPFRDDSTYNSYGNVWNGTTWINPQGWATTGIMVMPWSVTAPVPFPTTQLGSAVDMDSGYVYATTGFAFRAKLIAPAIPDVGMITITSPVIGDENFMDTMPAVQGLYIIPEPAGALLLLAGLPMLRRRR